MVQKRNKFEKTVDSFKQGDPVRFKAVLESIGDEWNTTALLLREIQKIEEFIEKDHKIKLMDSINEIEGVFEGNN